MVGRRGGCGGVDFELVVIHEPTKWVLVLGPGNGWLTPLLIPR